MKPSTITFRKALGYFLVMLLAFYLLISLYLLLVPRSVFLTGKITQYYSWFLLPGPYFRDDRLRAVPHLTISYKSVDGLWSEPRNVEMENFLSYHDALGYSKLKRSRYERYLAKSFSQLVKKDTSFVIGRRSFKELHRYLKFHYLPGDTDSVRLMYHRVDAAGSWSAIHQLQYKSF